MQHSWALSFSLILSLASVSACKQTTSIIEDPPPQNSAGQINEAPVLLGQSLSVNMNSLVEIKFSASDANNNWIRYFIVSRPVHGALSPIHGDSLTYRPDENYFGSDSFSVKANDGTTDSETVTVDLSILLVNRAPVATDRGITIIYNTPTPIILTATDEDQDTLVYSLAQSPTHGTLSGTAPNLTYTPASGYLGTDLFTFNVSDGKLTSAAGTIRIRVTQDTSVGHLFELAFTPYTLGLAIPVVDNVQRSISLSGLPSGRIFSFSLSEDNAASTGFTCSNLPSTSRINGNRLHLDLGLKASLGTLDLSCSTSHGPLTIHLGYTASSLSVVSSSPVESLKGISSNGNFPSQSADGRYIVWQSQLSSLNNVQQIAVKDTSTGVIRLVSSTPSGFEGDSGSAFPQITADGRFVVFYSNATNLIPGVVGYQVYRKDLQTGALLLISSSDGTAAGQADGGSGFAQITPDGRYVVFFSQASNLVNGVSGQQIYRKDLQDNVLKLVSSRNELIENQGDGDSDAAQITPDGRFVVFRSLSSNLVSGASGLQIYRKDLRTNAIALVSSTDGTADHQGNSGDGPPNITADGRLVVFCTAATNLLQGVSGLQIYLKDLQTGLLTLISSNDSTATNQGDDDSQSPEITPDGHFIVFSSIASNLVSETSGRQIFLKNLQNDTLTLVSSSDGSAAPLESGSRGNPKISTTGRFVVFDSWISNIISGEWGSQVYQMDLQSRTLSLTSLTGLAAADQGNRGSYNPQITPDKHFAVFECASSNLIADTSRTVVQICRKDLQTGAIALVSSTDGTSATEANGQSDNPQISADGRFVVFSSGSSNLVAGSSGLQIYLKDLQTEEITIVSSIDGTASQQGDLWTMSPQITPDGRFVVFLSNSSNLIANESSSGWQIYRKELPNGPITLVSSIDGTVANEANDQSYAPQITADGRFVVFYSHATNLVSGASKYQLYRKDLQTDEITLVSSRDEFVDNKSDVDIFSNELYRPQSQITDDGRFVVFYSTASNLIDGVSGSQIYLKDIEAQTLTLISSNDGSWVTQGDGDSNSPRITPDGLFVVFNSSATNLVPGATGLQIYLKNLATSEITLISSNDGSTANQGDDACGLNCNQNPDSPQITPDGRFIVFRAAASNLVKGVYESQIYLKEVY